MSGCTISAPDTVGSIGDFEITSGMYLLAQYGAYQQAAQLAGSDQDASDVKAFLKETITTDSDSGETAVVSDYVAQTTQATVDTSTYTRPATRAFSSSSARIVAMASVPLRAYDQPNAILSAKSAMATPTKAQSLAFRMVCS